MTQDEDPNSHHHDDYDQEETFDDADEEIEADQ